VKRALIIGGGFAGFQAARRLSRHRMLETVLVDGRATSDFLPVLPDIAGGRLRAQNCRFSLASACRKHGVEFVQAKVEHIDLGQGAAATAAGAIKFDYLLIASGSHTFFHGQDQFRKHAFTLDSVEDASRIDARLKQGDCDNVVVAGGGYTGIEIATHINRRLTKAGRPRPVTIVEIAPRILSPMPDELRSYTEKNLAKRGIRTLTDIKVADATAGAVTLSDGTSFTNPLFIWAAGVTAASHVQELPVDKTRQGRLQVDQFLRVAENCFAAGDAASFVKHDKPLRMAVQFSISEGLCAAENIIRAACGQPLKAFAPVDLGYVIPMAGGRSSGVVLGLRVKGWLPTALHYFMSLYRTHGWPHRMGMLRDLGTAPFRRCEA